MTDAELHWAAGLIDGEGYIGISRARCTRRGGLPVYQAKVRVAMCHRPTVERLQQLFGAGHVLTHISKRLTARDSFVWCVQSRLAEGVLVALRPHLFTKRAQADAVLAYLACVDRKSGTRTRPDEAKRTIYEAYYQGLRMLNEVGR